MRGFLRAVVSPSLAVGMAVLTVGFYLPVITCTDSCVSRKFCSYLFPPHLPYYECVCVCEGEGVAMGCLFGFCATPLYSSAAPVTGVCVCLPSACMCIYGCVYVRVFTVEPGTCSDTPDHLRNALPFLSAPRCWHTFQLSLAHTPIVTHKLSLSHTHTHTHTP